MTSMKRLMTAARRESGTAMLESAIALPCLLLVLFAIFEFGLAFARTQVLTNAAREGARAASLFRRSCKSGEVQSAVKDAVNHTGAQLGMSAGALSITTAHVCEAGAQVQVTVAFVHHLPVVAGLSKFVGGSATAAEVTLRAQAEMLNESL
jgi:Flp pilus assembly protein TadG